MSDDNKSDPGVEQDDHLHLADNSDVHLMLMREGDNEPEREKVLFSDHVIKINKREKGQTRVLLITDKAVYNLKPKKLSKSKRRIPIASIYSITASKITTEFVVHVTDEYDYRFKSDKKERILKLLKRAYQRLIEQKEIAAKLVGHAQAATKEGEERKGEKKRSASLGTTLIAKSDLKDLALTKAMARLQTREEKMRRRMAIMAEHHESDDEEDNEEERAKPTENLLPGHAEHVSIADFELKTVLGRGVSGKVVLVSRRSTGKHYAMKIMKKSVLIETNQIKNTQAERKILQQLQHPFLMNLRWAFQTSDKLYFVLDYFPGGELFFHLKKMRRFSEAVAKIYVAEVALALGHLHSLGIVYRDLKPENILLDENGHCCLTDFGLSKDIDPKDVSHTFCGTPEYIAPEIITNVGHGMAVDWWSLGILLYELTVGIPPFYSQNSNQMYKLICHGTLKFPPFLSPACKSLIVALLNRRPHKRLGSKNDVEDIRQHEFFEGFDWDALMRKEIDPAYKPSIASITDTRNFDDVFTQELLVDSDDEHASDIPVAEFDEAFKDFDFEAERKSESESDEESRHANF